MHKSTEQRSDRFDNNATHSATLESMRMPAEYRDPAFTSGIVTEGLQTEVRKASAQLNSLKIKLDQFKEARNRIRSEIRNLYDSAGYRELHLPRWLTSVSGGDTELVDNFKRAILQRQSIHSSICTLNASIGRPSQVLHNTIDKFLMDYDPGFAELKDYENRTNEIIAAARKYLKKLKEVTDLVKEAEDAETLDAVSNNRGFAFLSYIVNDDASDGLEEVKNAALEFEKTLKQHYRAKATGDYKLSPEIGIDDLSDTLIDFLGSFDLMSIFVLEKLGEARNALETASSNTDKILADLYKQREIIEANKQEWHNSIIQACLL